MTHSKSTVYHSLRKKPKDGSWKKILWEPEEQDAFCRDHDFSYTVYGDFSSKSIEAFTDRWKFTVVPFVETGVYVFRKDDRWTEDLRFGFEDIGSEYFELWRKNRVIPEKGSLPKLVDAPLNWDFHRSYNGDSYGSRYIAKTVLSKPYGCYFYMDRVI
jgi:hypothetical protein